MISVEVLASLANSTTSKMDRVAFLRSLPYLRQLDPEIWAAATATGSGNDESQEIYSGSTVTPPTPSKNKSLLLFEESAVVSIEPRIVGAQKESNKATNNEDGDEIMHMDVCRKRGRSDLDVMAPTNVSYNFSAPAFFHQYKFNTKESDVANNLETNHVEQKKDDFQSINNDPALCSFEAAIIRHNTNPLGSPGKQDGEEKCDDDISNWLLFRFGCRFVYLVDQNAIINVTCCPSTDEKDGSAECKDAIQSPPMKRQKNANAEGETAQTASTNAEQVTRPASLLVSFPFCSFRMFSLQTKNDESAQEGTNGTRSFLLKTVMTAEERLMKARSMLLKHFVLDDEMEKLQNRSVSREMMSSGRSSSMHHDFEDEAAIVNSSAPPFLVSQTSRFLDEDWSFCVDDNKTLSCASLPSSPQKKISPSKEGSSSAKDSSSSPFENGQKVNIPEKQSSDSLKEDEEERRSDTEYANGGDDLEEGDKKTDSEKEEVHNDDAGDEEISLTEKKEIQDTGIETENGEEYSWQHELLNKRCSFDASWSSVQKTMHNISTHTQTMQDGKVSNLTRAAQLLSLSYLSPQELVDMKSQSEDNITAATTGIEKEIERIFPGRGSRKPTGKPTDLGKFREKIEHLLRLRKESVDAKIALLLTPKR